MQVQMRMNIKALKHWYLMIRGSKQRWQENVNANLEQVGFRNIGVKERPNLTVLRRTKIPAILIEAGF